MLVCTRADALLGKTNGKSGKNRSMPNTAVPCYRFSFLLFSWCERWQTCPVPASDTARKGENGGSKREGEREQQRTFSNLLCDVIRVCSFSSSSSSSARHCDRRFLSENTLFPQPSRSNLNRSKWDGDFLSHVHLYWTDLRDIIITCCIRCHQYYSRYNFPKSGTCLDGSQCFTRVERRVCKSPSSDPSLSSSTFQFALCGGTGIISARQKGLYVVNEQLNCLRDSSISSLIDTMLCRHQYCHIDGWLC